MIYRSKKLLIATQNKNKQREYSQILSACGFGLDFPADVGLKDLEIAETDGSIKNNALLKANAFSLASSWPSIADDFGIEIEALNGLPGAHAKRFYAGTDHDRNKYIIKLLKNKKNKKARCICYICLVDVRKNIKKCFAGIISGKIADQERGKDGFGYDYIFIPEGYNQTIAELGSKIKNQIGHRAIALNKLKKYLQNKNHVS